MSIAGPATSAAVAADRERSDRLAGRLGLAGASLGIIAGFLELDIGPDIRDWVGGKLDTTRLGWATIILSMVALAAVRALRGRTGRDRVGIAIGLLVPALVCFTTVGRLWYPPGVLLLAAGAIVLAGTRRDEIAAAYTADHWRAALLIICGACFVLLGASAPGLTAPLGILSGALVLSVPRLASRSPRAAWAALLAGTLPFAAATWWSAVTPLVAVIAIVIGNSVIRHARSARASPSPAEKA